VSGISFSVVVWIILSAVSFVIAFLVCWALGYPKAIWIVPVMVTVPTLLNHRTHLEARTVLGIAIYVISSLAGGWLAISARRRQVSHASN
jgi:hypothetical protein